jgi:hypothetical protein
MIAARHSCPGVAGGSTDDRGFGAPWASAPVAKTAPTRARAEILRYRMGLSDGFAFHGRITIAQALPAARKKKCCNAKNRLHTNDRLPILCVAARRLRSLSASWTFPP